MTLISENVSIARRRRAQKPTPIHGWELITGRATHECPFRVKSLEAAKILQAVDEKADLAQIAWLRMPMGREDFSRKAFHNHLLIANSTLRQSVSNSGNPRGEW